jgi:hypothetical protein
VVTLAEFVIMHETFKLTEPHTLKIEVTGTGDPVLVGYLDGAPLLTLTDTSLRQRGRLLALTKRALIPTIRAPCVS